MRRRWTLQELHRHWLHTSRARENWCGFNWLNCNVHGKSKSVSTRIDLCYCFDIRVTSTFAFEKGKLKLGTVAVQTEERTFCPGHIGAVSLNQPFSIMPSIGIGRPVCCELEKEVNRCRHRPPMPIDFVVILRSLLFGQARLHSVSCMIMHPAYVRLQKYHYLRYEGDPRVYVRVPNQQRSNLFLVPRYCCSHRYYVYGYAFSQGNLWVRLLSTK